MLSEILKHTPPWVFVLLFVLLGFGWVQSRPRTISVRSAAILPTVMILLSLYGIWSAFGPSPVGILAWLVGVAVAVLLNRRLGFPRGAISLRSNRPSCFQAAGSR